MNSLMHTYTYLTSDFPLPLGCAAGNADRPDRRRDDGRPPGAAVGTRGSKSVPDATTLPAAPSEAAVGCR